MDINKLDKANKIRAEIKTVEELLVNCRTAKCEWIQFTWGNGSNRPSVCSHPDIIEEVRKLLITANEAELSRLNESFEKL